MGINVPKMPQCVVRPTYEGGEVTANRTAMIVILGGAYRLPRLPRALRRLLLTREPPPTLIRPRNLPRSGKPRPTIAIESMRRSTVPIFSDGGPEGVSMPCLDSTERELLPHRKEGIARRTAGSIGLLLLSTLWFFGPEIAGNKQNCGSRPRGSSYFLNWRSCRCQ